MRSDQRRTRGVPALLFLLAALFFLSGTSALIYQMLWLRLIGLVFGVTVYAASTVWAVIARTFLSVFPETTLWGDGTLMLGSVEPLRLRREDLEWKLQVPRRREMIATLGVHNFEELLRLYVTGPDELRQFVGDGPILTDDKPLVEYFLSCRAIVMSTCLASRET